MESHGSLAKRLGLEALLVKREDLNGASFGGNKLRALEWILPAAGPNDPILVTRPLAVFTVARLFSLGREA